MATFSLSYSGQPTAVTFNVVTGVVTNGFTGANTTVADELVHFGYSGVYDPDVDVFQITGTGLADTITAGNGGSTLTGSGGADVLTGGTGADNFRYTGGENIGAETIAGGAGADTIVVAGGAAFVFTQFSNAAISGIERAQFGSDRGGEFSADQVGEGKIAEFVGTPDGPAFVSFRLPSARTFDLAALTFTEWHPNNPSHRTIQVLGSGGDDTIVAADLSTRMDGGGGADTLIGGNGNDLFGYGFASEIVAGESVNGGGGTDRMFFFEGGIFDLSVMSIQSVEEILLDDTTPATLILNSDQIGGSAITSIVTSGGTRHLIVNGGQTDLANLDVPDWSALGHTITINGTAANDALTGSSEDDLINGSNGKDILAGGDGADILAGGDGADRLSGGAGGDVFDYGATSETGKTAATRDRIMDFTHSLDRIDLSAIDANGLIGDGDTAFSFRAKNGAKFTGVEGQLRWFRINEAGTAHDRTIIAADIDGDKHADFQIELTGLVTLTADDFML